MTTERHEKSAALKADWESLGTPADPGFFDRLAKAPLENVVTARRIYGEGAESYRIDEILVERVEPRMAAEASKMAKGHGSFYRGEIEGEIFEGFWRDVLAGESFFEIAFGFALFRVGQAARRKVLEGKQRKRERTASRIGISGEEGDEADRVAEEWPAAKQIGYEEAGFQQLEDRELLDAVLAQMPAEMAKAMILHVVMDLKIHSKEADETTVASELGYAERKTRELIADGRELMSKLLERELKDE